METDYDNDGNNIVPCPLCLSNSCPSKEGGKCPEEDMFVLEGEIKLLLHEYITTEDDSRIANVLEVAEKMLTQHLQDLEKKVADKIDLNKIRGHYQEDDEQGNMARGDDTIASIKMVAEKVNEIISLLERI